MREQGSIGSTRPFSPRLFVAFAEVPRERYLGKGPWKISRPSDPWTKIETPDCDPERLYDDVLVSIIADKGLANGLQSGHARWLNALGLQPSDRVLHCGCGTGYYTAIIAHVVGNSGHVTAIELEQSLASLAEKNLRHVSHVEVIAGNATTYDAGKADAIYVSAGATHPLPLLARQSHARRQVNFPDGAIAQRRESWIVNARAGNRDFETGLGLMLRIQRTATGYATAVVPPAVFFPCFGAIDPDPEADRIFAQALRSGAIAQANSLRSEAHDRDPTCLVHTQRYCFSKLPAG